MNPHDTLRQALDILQGVIDADNISDTDLTKPTPCTEFDVAALGDHIVDTHNFLLGAAGGEPVVGNGSLSSRHAEAAKAAVAAWATRGTDGTIELGGNELPAEFGLALHALEAYVHGWDLATALGRAFQPSAQLTDQIAEIAGQIVTDDARGDFDGAPYRPAVSTDSTNAVDMLIAHTGRNPA